MGWHLSHRACAKAPLRPSRCQLCSGWGGEEAEQGQGAETASLCCPCGTRWAKLGGSKIQAGGCEGTWALAPGTVMGIVPMASVRVDHPWLLGKYLPHSLPQFPHHPWPGLPSPSSTQRAGGRGLSRWTTVMVLLWGAWIQGYCSLQLPPNTTPFQRCWGPWGSLS